MRDFIQVYFSPKFHYAIYFETRKHNILLNKNIPKTQFLFQFKHEQ